MPKTLRILPKCQNFAKSGHTGCKLWRDLNWTSRPLFRLFSVFSIKHYNFTKINMKSIHPVYSSRDLNSQPSDYEAPLLTTRPGLPPVSIYFIVWVTAEKLISFKRGRVQMFYVSHDREVVGSKSTSARMRDWRDDGEGVGLWHSCYRVHFWYQRTAVWIQT